MFIGKVPESELLLWYKCALPEWQRNTLQNLRGEGLRTFAVCGLQACEYLNDPPLIYIGNKMSCLKMKKLERPEPPRKKNVTWCGRELMHWLPGLPSSYDCYSSPWEIAMALIEIDGVYRSFHSMVDGPSSIHRDPQVLPGLVMSTVCYWSHGPVEIVDLPMKNGWIFP